LYKVVQLVLASTLVLDPHNAPAVRDKLIERANVAYCSRGIAGAALSSREYALMKDAARARRDLPGAPPTSPSTVTDSTIEYLLKPRYREERGPGAYFFIRSSMIE